MKTATASPNKEPIQDKMHVVYEEDRCSECHEKGYTSHDCLRNPQLDAYLQSDESLGTNRASFNLPYNPDTETDFRREKTDSLLG